MCEATGLIGYPQVQAPPDQIDRACAILQPIVEDYAAEFADALGDVDKWNRAAVIQRLMDRWEVSREDEERRMTEPPDRPCLVRNRGSGVRTEPGKSV